jgi:hypothetical protein
MRPSAEGDGPPGAGRAPGLGSPVPVGRYARAMPTSSPVWMVHARTGLAGRKGSLLLEQRQLVFRPERVGHGDTRMALERIGRVRRVRGTPILEVYPREPSLPEIIGFYFIEPPSIGEDRTNSAYGRLNPFRAKAGRRAALAKLRFANSLKKDEVQGWVDAIRSWKPATEQASPGGAQDDG